jgi:predicted PurR-regulated permease PerM
MIFLGAYLILTTVALACVETNTVNSTFLKKVAQLHPLVLLISFFSWGTSSPKKNRKNAKQKTQ